MPNNILSYNNVSLCQSDAKLEAYLAATQSISGGNWTSTPYNQISPNNLSIEGFLGGKSLAPLNWAPAPMPQINRLNIPTGASRWSTFIGIVNNPNYNQIVGGIDFDDIQPQTLAIDQFTIPMYLLAAKQVTSLAKPGNDDPMWLLLFVDCRWFLQIQDTGNLSLNSSSTWNTFYTAIQAACNVIGISFTIPTIPASYQSPDWYELSRTDQSLPVLMDIVSDGLNRRIIFNPSNGHLTCVGPPTSSSVTSNKKTLGSNWMQLNGTTGGGDPTNNLPSALDMAFNAFGNNRPYCKQTIYEISTDAPDGFNSVNGTGLAIHSTMYADFTSQINANLITSDPTNYSTLNSFAIQYNTDWYNWRKEYFDVVLLGAQKWAFGGFEDRVEIMWQPGRALTRAISMSYNFGSDVNYSQDYTLSIAPTNELLVKTTAPIQNGQYGSAQIVNSLGTPTTGIISVWATNSNLASGLVATAEYNCQDNKWYIVNASSHNQLAVVYDNYILPNGLGYVQPVDTTLIPDGQLFKVTSVATVFVGDLVVVFKNNSDGNLWANALNRPLLAQLYYPTTVAQGGMAQVKIFDSNGNVAHPADPIILSGVVFPGAGASGTQWLEIFWDYYQRQWYAVPFVSAGQATIIYGTLSSTLTGSNSVSCAVGQYLSGTNPGTPVTVYQPLGSTTLFTGTSGATYCAFWDTNTSKYYFNWVSC